ncbi:MAG: hypothetical protein M1826_000698 [Phylliscum demangeonii]|nr:MAG: hypothetical protein M1826_000698 [Phylliscum demangeonii]
MSEYWKSTPKYWCKHCKTYVRDTKFERTQHEATGRHQGNLKRYIRDLHRGHERDERESERAKQEVERLNGVVSGGAFTARTSGPPMPSAPPAPTAEERLKQLAQLADMGVAIPDEYRGHVALAGEWQILSETVVHPRTDDEGTERKSAVRRTGRFKREHSGDDDADDDDDDDGDGDGHKAPRRRRNWGSSTRTYPTAPAHDDPLDALLRRRAPASDSSPMTGAATTARPTENGREDGTAVKTEPGESAVVKIEPGESAVLTQAATAALAPAPGDRDVGDDAGVNVLFKKRKAKNIRQK